MKDRFFGVYLSCELCCYFRWVRSCGLGRFSLTGYLHLTTSYAMLSTWPSQLFLQVNQSKQVLSKWSMTFPDKFTCLRYHIRSPLPLSTLSVLPITMIFISLMLGQLWPKPGALPPSSSLLLYSLIFFVRLIFFLEVKCTESASVWLMHWEALYKYLYTTQNIQATMQLSDLTLDSVVFGSKLMFIHSFRPFL